MRETDSSASTTTEPSVLCVRGLHFTGRDIQLECGMLAAVIRSLILYNTSHDLLKQQELRTSSVSAWCSSTAEGC